MNNVGMDDYYPSDGYEESFEKPHSYGLPPRESRFKPMYWVPLFFSIVYFVLIAMLWANTRWFRQLNVTLSPVILTVVWALVFVGIIWTWIRCLDGASSRGNVAWITFAFIANLLLLLLVGYAFFVTKNVATAAVAMVFLWISTFIMIFVAARFWPPGIVWMIIYLVVISWAWIMFGRLAYTVARNKNKMLVSGLFKTMGLNGEKKDFSGAFGRLKKYFDLNETASPTTASPPANVTTQAVPVAMPAATSPDTFDNRGRGVRKQPTRYRAVDQTLEAPVPQAGTPQGTWRSRGLSSDSVA